MTLEILTADPLAQRHGFFTRHGGASGGIYKGLNCGFGSADQAHAVTLNRARVAAAIGVDLENLATVHQYHSAQVLTVNGPLGPNRPKADAMVTATPNTALGILTADCAPVLFADSKAGVVGAAHAGWQGALNGVLEATLEAMQALGAERANITAVIGPCISQQSYEVGPEFMDSFMADDPENARFFAQGAGDRVQFDLPAFGLHRLRRAGVTDAEWIRHCTYRDPDRFYSYRRCVHQNEADYGRLISVIRT